MGQATHSLGSIFLSFLKIVQFSFTPPIDYSISHSNIYFQLFASFSPSEGAFANSTRCGATSHPTVQNIFVTETRFKGCKPRFVKVDLFANWQRYKRPRPLVHPHVSPSQPPFALQETSCKFYYDNRQSFAVLSLSDLWVQSAFAHG